MAEKKTHAYNKKGKLVPVKHCDIAVCEADGKNCKLHTVSVGQILKENEPFGSCVFIGDKFVLSAKHVFNDKELLKYAFLFKGKKYKGKSMITNSDSTLKDNCDLVIIELSESIKNITPALVCKQFDELKSNVVGVGFGASGVASKPQDVKNKNKKIAGENVVDSLGGYFLNGNPILMFCDFDHPSKIEYNKMGDPTPRQLEYICVGGDSGGGLFRQAQNRWELIGICYGMQFDISQLMKTGYYGQIMMWTRVSVFYDWINDNTK